MEETVKVFIRVRPPFDIEIKSEDFKKCIELQDNVVSLTYPRDTTRDFCFDGVFHERTSESQVFESSAKPLVLSVLSGYSGTLFVYGQTGTGKTHTMGILKKLGPKSDGIVPRSVKLLLEKLPSGSTASLSFLQIYMENIYDLLSAESKPLPLREDPSGEVYVQDLVQVRLQDPSQALALLNTGLSNRIMGSQNVNQTSSRSHIVLTLSVSTQTSAARLTLVDLAGSERVRKTSSTGLRLDEAKFINASLSTLGKVINSLGSQSASHVPYRDSKLTRVLKPSLSGGARMVLIATVGPAYANGGESLSTLQFAARCKEVVLTPIPPIDRSRPNEPVLSENRDTEQRLLLRIRELEDLKAPNFSHLHSEAVLYLLKLLGKLTQASVQLRKEAGRIPLQYVPEPDRQDEDTPGPEENESLLLLSSEAIVDRGERVLFSQFARTLAENLNYLGRAAVALQPKTLTNDPSVQVLDLPDPLSSGSTPKQPAAKRSALSLKELLKGSKTAAEELQVPQRKPSAESYGSAGERRQGSRTPEPVQRGGRRQGEGEDDSKPKRLKSVTPPKARPKPVEPKPAPPKDDFLSQLEDELQKIGGGDDIDDWLRQHAAS